MDNHKIAFATDNGETFVNRHFGDAKYFDIYTVNSGDLKYIKRIENTTEEDSKEVHGDPKKAKGILELLKKEDVQILVSKIFGPNINRIKKKFVCVLVNHNKISDSFEDLQKRIDIINMEWEKGEERNHLDFRNKIRIEI